MKNIMFPMICFIVMFSSCITSLHPLTTAGQITSDNRVLGSWTTDDDTIQITRFTESDPYKGLIKLQPFSNGSHNGGMGVGKEDSIMYARGYCVSFRKNNMRYYMYGALTRIDNNLFFDLYPVISEDVHSKESTGFELTNDYLPTFTMAKLEISGNYAMNLQFLNGDFIKEMISKGQARIRHEKDALFETFLITASTDELRQFVKKYSHDERLFGKENSITLTRKG